MVNFFKDRVERYPYDIGSLVLRLCAGAMMVPHGFTKILRFYEPAEIDFPDPFVISPAISLALAAFAEFFCAIAVIVGFKTRVAALMLMITMLVALLSIHIMERTTRHELPLLYLVAFTSVFIFGGGQFSIDYKLSQRKKQDYYY